MTWPPVQNQASPAYVQTLPPGQSAYDALVLSHGPTMYLPMSSTVFEADRSGYGNHGTYHSTTVTQSTMPNGQTVAVFNGTSNYCEVPDSATVSTTNTGILTIEAWIRPDVLTFPVFQSTGYVHWAGKGTVGNHEWVCRMYNFTTTDTPSRPNRISGYCFNLAGSQGVGAYFQDTVVAGQWIHFAVTINSCNTSLTYPTGYTTIFKNSVQRDTQSLSSLSIVPSRSTAPVRIGTRDLGSYFQGAIGCFAIYNYELTSAQLLTHYNAMMVGF